MLPQTPWVETALAYLKAMNERDNAARESSAVELEIFSQQQTLERLGQDQQTTKTEAHVRKRIQSNIQSKQYALERIGKTIRELEERYQTQTANPKKLEDEEVETARKEKEASIAKEIEDHREEITRAEKTIVRARQRIQELESEKEGAIAKAGKWAQQKAPEHVQKIIRETKGALETAKQQQATIGRDIEQFQRTIEQEVAAAVDPIVHANATTKERAVTKKTAEEGKKRIADDKKATAEKTLGETKSAFDMPAMKRYIDEKIAADGVMIREYDQSPRGLLLLPFDDHEEWRVWNYIFSEILGVKHIERTIIRDADKEAHVLMIDMPLASSVNKEIARRVSATEIGARATFRIAGQEDPGDFVRGLIKKYYMSERDAGIALKP